MGENTAKDLMMNRYHTYGNGSVASLAESYVIKDTKEDREEIFYDFSYDYALDSKEAFIDGEISEFHFDRGGGDWDEPTGGYIELSSREELEKEIRDKADAELANVRRLFEGSN